MLKTCRNLRQNGYGKLLLKNLYLLLNNKNMKKILLIFSCLAVFCSLNAQSFKDSFDSYTAGSYLTQDNHKYRTWLNGTGKDVQISDARAHSGKNSIYFSSSLSAGGPTDIILPFGGQYNTGNFTLEMWIYVDNGHVGYFNIQADSVEGQVWAMEFNMFSDGTYDLINTASGTLLSGSYTQGGWQDVKLNIDLSHNAWELLINNTSQGKFINSYNQVASLDIYAKDSSSFYIDDLSYNYSAPVLTNLDAAVLSIGNIQSVAGQSSYPSVLVRNLGKTTITSCNLSFAYNSDTIKSSFTGLSLNTGDTATLTFTSPILLVAGSNIGTATVFDVNGSLNDSVASDDSKSIVIDPIIPATDKLVIAEEATGTWCGWCVRGIVYIGNMVSKYGQFIQPIVVHNNDPMVDTPYDAIMATKITGFPTVIVDRTYTVDPSLIESNFLSRLKVAPHAVIHNGGQFNQSTDQLKVSLTTKFNQAVAGSGYRIACVIVEDGVSGTGTTWDQHNYYSGGGYGPMGGFENLPPYVAGLKFDHVARVISPGFYGNPNSYPASVSAGDSFTHDFLFNISNYNSANIHIVGMLIAPDGSIDNGSTATISQATANGYLTGTFVAGIRTLDGPDAMQIYPNPANDIINISGFRGKGMISISDISGKMLLNQEMNFNGSDNSISVGGLSDGVYLLQIRTDNEIHTSKIIISR